MSKVQMLRAFVNQRLTAAADEIFELFERTIAEYEEELYRSKENHRQQKLVDDVSNHEVQSHRADGQQLSMVEEEVPPEQQEWSSSLDQEDPEPPHIKEEQENPEPAHIKEEQEGLWITPEGEKLQEADIKFLLTSIPVKSEEEEAQSSQLHETESREAEHFNTEADGEDCGGPEPARNSDPNSLLQPATHDNGDFEKTKEPQSGLNSLQNDEVLVSVMECNTGETSVGSSECAGSFDNKLQKRAEIQTEDKLFSCSVCDKRFAMSSSLMSHLVVHLDGKCFTSSDCRQKFDTNRSLLGHTRTHTEEKPFVCLVCGQRFTYPTNLRQHLAGHTGEKPLNCPVCYKSFTRRSNLTQHLSYHTREKPLRQYGKRKCVGESSGNK